MTDSLEKWQSGAIALSKREPPRQNECKLPFSVILSCLFLFAIIVAFAVIAAPLYVGVQQGHASLAGDVQNLTTANAVALLTTVLKKYLRT